MIYHALSITFTLIAFIYYIYLFAQSLFFFKKCIKTGSSFSTAAQQHSSTAAQQTPRSRCSKNLISTATDCQQSFLVVAGRCSSSATAAASSLKCDVVVVCCSNDKRIGHRI